MLCEFTRKHEPDRSLNLAGGKCRLLVVSGKFSSLGSDSLEDIVDEGVHNGHTLLANTGIWVDLLKDLVDVGAVRFGTLLTALLIACLLRGLGGLLARCLGHLGC